MTPQMSVLPSRPFATKTSGGFQPALLQLRDVARFELPTSDASAPRRSSDTVARSTRE